MQNVYYIFYLYIVDNESTIGSFLILSAFPNPFNPTVTLKYNLSRKGSIKIKIYNITCEMISTLLDGYKTNGWHSINWDGNNQYGKKVAAGSYICQLSTDYNIETTKLILLK